MAIADAISRQGVQPCWKRNFPLSLGKARSLSKEIGDDAGLRRSRVFTVHVDG